MTVTIDHTTLTTPQANAAAIRRVLKDAGVPVVARGKGDGGAQVASGREGRGYPEAEIRIAGNRWSGTARRDAQAEEFRVAAVSALKSAGFDVNAASYSSAVLIVRPNTWETQKAAHDAARRAEQDARAEAERARGALTAEARQLADALTAALGGQRVYAKTTGYGGFGDRAEQVVLTNEQARMFLALINRPEEA